MGVYAKSTRNKKFFKKRPRKGAKRSRPGYATKRDLYMLSKQVSNTREIKHAFANQIFDFGSYNAPNDTFTQTWRVVSLAIDGSGGFSIPQGVQDSQRIGNQIRVKKVMLKANFIPVPVTGENVIPRPQIIKVYFGYVKSQVGVARGELPSAALDFFKVAGTNAPPQGDVRDLNKTINNDLYTIVKKSKNIKVGNSAYFQGQGADQDFNNNDFNLFQSYSADLTKFYHKNQKFNEADAGSSNRGLYMYVTCVDANGTQSSSLPMQMSYEVCMTYTDA
uniref:Uncharacterized protein n=1 Tax=uncultured marine virus TaxID=186617 RepID=S4TEF9_9VIRU|nr:hypothetical protein [uncultured marine virus]